ncbi:MAG: hypothetical protein J2P53_14410 [Bradyrhizobiaceae bacterium]|nr:hypothetical protein [Bradyrhizobiaceae bacterium]
MHCRRPDTALATALIAWRGHHLLESTDLTTNNAPTTPPKNSLAGLPKFAFTPQTDGSVVSSPAALHTPIIRAAADHDGSRPDYRLYEVQNGNHIETYAATFPQLQYVDPHAQNAFGPQVAGVEGASALPSGGAFRWRRDRRDAGGAGALRESARGPSGGNIRRGRA